MLFSGIDLHKRTIAIPTVDEAGVGASVLIGKPVGASTVNI